ncbi:MAG: S24 family peptidase [Candidatus Dojkabacteria bacterium]|uniref:LexA repressor n=2 Tax=Candidatus Dojkabacteria TaxID=74243 RepID=A0A136KKU6_9BACT|nr:MAG: LexA repressor [candidate division WS6 bacterium OLB21]MBW7954075.1 LexA family transcriptional regulator [Candidatus Dojkabacteria bacterium]WKZ28028.1 MAG: S24 family peptidase [Candidatus Dojkabacteria bacterium]
MSVTTSPVGFASPAEDVMERSLDLHELLVKHPAATFFVRVSGNQLAVKGIFTDDILIVDRSLKPTINSLIVAIIEGDFVLGYFNSFSKKDNLEVWGVVVSLIRENL